MKRSASMGTTVTVLTVLYFAIKDATDVVISVLVEDGALPERDPGRQRDASPHLSHKVQPVFI